MPFPFPELTPKALRRRILRWNLEQCAWGGTILACSVLLWGPTVYITFILVAVLRRLPNLEFSSPMPWNEQDVIVRGLSVFVLLVVTWLGVSRRSPLFVAEDFDPYVTGIDLPEWKLNVQGGTEFWCALPGLAPALTLFGLRIFGRCFSVKRSRINLACRTYAYLKHLDDWVAYPKLLSQRQAVILLYHMDLIHISHRFGKLEIRARHR